MDKRYVNLEGAYNFRDIGGYKTKYNLYVKYKKLYRSDELSKITNKDVKVLEQLKLKTIIDFRNEKERRNNLDVEIPAVNVIHLDPIADIAALASCESGDKQDIYDSSKMTAELAKFLMTEQNREFVRSNKCKEVYREMFDIILNENNQAIVQHCRGGKDRTGYGIALILLTLGVSQEDVIEDYLLTNYYKKDKNEKSLKELKEKTGNDDFVQAVRYFKEANEGFIKTALEFIDNDYGGIDQYVQNELGLKVQDIEKLKNLYLE